MHFGAVQRIAVIEFIESPAVNQCAEAAGKLRKRYTQGFLRIVGVNPQAPYEQEPRKSDDLVVRKN